MKKIALIAVLLVIALYVFVNFSYVVASFKVHNMVAKDDVKNTLFEQYLVATATTRAEGCSFNEEVLSLQCTKPMSAWALGKYSDILDKGIHSK